MSGDRFEELFGETTDVVCAFHGYARALHQLLHGRPNAGRFHVHGYSEQGTTTTPFDMVVLNEMSRYHLVLDALRRARRIAPGARGARAATARRCSCAITPTSASTSRTCPRCATGPGRPRCSAEARARPRRQRGLEQPQARARRHGRRDDPRARRGALGAEPGASDGRHAQALRAAFADAGAQGRGDRPPRRARRPELRRAGAHRLPACAPTIAALAPLARCTRARRWRASTRAPRAAGPAAGRVLRHGLSPHARPGGGDVRAAARVERALRTAPLRLSRPERRLVP